MTAPPGSPALRRGQSGPRVSELQLALNYASGAGLAGDGAFGPGTEQALRNLQLLFRTLHDPWLVVDGVYGARSQLWLQFAADARAKG